MENSESKIDKLFKGAGSAIRSFNEGIKSLGDLQAVTVKKCIESNIVVRKTQYTTEKNVENVISKQLNDEFGKVHQQYSIGGFLGLKCDIDLHDGKVGIEVKLAKELTTSGIERLFGQVLYYSRRTYKNNLIVLIVGTKKEFTRIIEEIEDILNEIGVEFIYLEVQ